MFVFGVLIAVLVIKPTGLFGERVVGENVINERHRRFRALG